MSNLLVGHVAAGLQRTDRVRIYVGGLPSVRQWPYEYKAGFSPIDVIEEYTRPARLVRGGKVEVCPALSELELIDFPDLGTLEAFVTDGLRTLARTIDAPDMIEKTMRYPGHAERMRMLRETGFFSEIPVDIDGASVRPIDVATRLLFPMWQMGEGDEDITIMRIVVEGLGRNRNHSHGANHWVHGDDGRPHAGCGAIQRTGRHPAGATRTGRRLHEVHPGRAPRTGHRVSQVGRAAGVPRVLVTDVRSFPHPTRDAASA
jgi:saccharopine dehydrogenase-like NADP-dependent oxidoreductase